MPILLIGRGELGKPPMQARNAPTVYRAEEGNGCLFSLQSVKGKTEGCYIIREGGTTTAFSSMITFYFAVGAGELTVKKKQFRRWVTWEKKDRKMCGKKR